MSARINQQLVFSYNPDGTPGTVTTGVEGQQGPPPTADAVLAAVETFLTSADVSVAISTELVSETFWVGSGATGAAGSYIEIGTLGGLDAWVRANSSQPQSNLHLASQNGYVQIEGNGRVTGTLDLLQDLALNDTRIRLRNDDDDLNYLQYTPGDPNLGTSGGNLMLSADTVGNLVISAPDQLPVIAASWFADLDPTRSIFSVDQLATVGNTTMGGMVWLSDGELLTSDDLSILTYSGGLTEVIAGSVVTYTDKAGATRRSLLTSGLSDALVDPNFLYADLVGLIGTLWQAVQELEIRERTT